MNGYRILRWTLLGCYMAIILRVSVPDYPYGVPLWESLTMDPNGYWHEVFYITGGFLAFVATTIFFEVLQTLKAFMNLWMEPYDPPRLFRVRRIKRKGP